MSGPGQELLLSIANKAIQDTTTWEDGTLEPRTIEDVVTKMQSAKKLGKKTTLLLGAGCSVTAGIPLPQKIVQQVQERFGPEYRRARAACQDDALLYHACMGFLDPGQRHELLHDCIEQAQINTAHLAIACLIEQGWVDRVLTVNFDNLTLRACALRSVFPAIFDLAIPGSADSGVPGHLAGFEGKAIVHLHGQHTHLALLNTEEACARQAKQVAPVFETAYQGPLIVCGYSGAGDPLFSHHLAQKASFYHSLYWVTGTEGSLESAVAARLSRPHQYAYRIDGFDADGFFEEIARTLGCFPPVSVVLPIPERAVPSQIRTEAETEAVVSERLAPVAFSAEPELIAPVAFSAETEALDEEAAVVAALRAYRLQQNRAATREERYETMWHIVAHYEKAIEAQPDYPAVLNNLGLVFAETAQDLYGDDRHAAQCEAIARYKEALHLKPDYPGALYNLGVVFAEMADDLQGEKRHAAQREAIARYEEALRWKAHYPEALNNKGAVFARMATDLSGQERDHAFARARESFLQAEEAGYKKAFYNLACLEALRGDEHQCRECLSKSQESGTLPSRERIENDADLESVRTHTWFQEFVAHLPPPAI
jgi:NAD-dependent SIR2 family protein deacetylase